MGGNSRSPYPHDTEKKCQHSVQKAASSFLPTAFISTLRFMLWPRVFALELPNLKHLYTRLLLLVSMLTLQVSGQGVQLLKDHLEPSN